MKYSACAAERVGHHDAAQQPGANVAQRILRLAAGRWVKASTRLVVMWPLALLLLCVGCGVSQLTLEDLPGSSLR